MYELMLKISFVFLFLSQNLKLETMETLQGSGRITEGNRRNTGRNMRKHQGKRREAVRKPGNHNIEGITMTITGI